MKTRLQLIGLLMGLSVLPALGQSPKRVILFIGDGVGASHWTSASLAAESLAVQRFQVAGLVDTRASNSKITDSAASATAYASGIRTYNGAIGVDTDTNSVETVFEVARDRGMATGLVATSTVTHATPAAFVAHVPSRSLYFEIAQQMAEFGLDVLLGGGLRHFDAATRPDTTDFLSVATGPGVFVASAAQLDSVDLTIADRLVGLFAADALPPARSRTPTLSQMTEAALQIVSRNPAGFFLAVEGSQPDWRAHDNEPIHSVATEMLDFDRAIAAGLDYQKDHPETLVVVVSDHETGGLAIHTIRDSLLLVQTAETLEDAIEGLHRSELLLDSTSTALADSTLHLLSRSSERLRILSTRTAGRVSAVARYTSRGHTGAMTPLFAAGPGAERFGGMIRNDKIGQLLLEFVRE
jgi:alkaline phosphatase